jgi:WD40 repeat protein/serine/threonine protein kinase
MPDHIEDLFDEYLDFVLTTGRPDEAGFLAAHPELDDAERALLRSLAASLAAGLGGEPSDARPDLDGRTSVAPADPRRAIPTEEPETFGDYRILRVLGHGGQGVVYLAEDSRLNRKVALKVLRRPDLAAFADASPHGPAARLRREAELASKLDHPGICVVYEMGVVKNSPYVAMRYVEGETLASMIAAAREAGRRSIRSPAEVDAEPAQGRGALLPGVNLVESAARALHVAHSAGVIHRDIKPANVMVTRGGEPVLLDFGLAFDETNDLPSITKTGQLFGSPGYMSPEQIKPPPGGLDPRTDVYSLGIVLHECLTARRPFEEATREDLFHAVLSDPLPDPRRWNAAIDRDLSVVLATALERDRDRRYQTALDFAEDLRRWRSYEPILAHPAGWLLRVRRWTQRNRVLTASALAIGVLLVGLLVASQSVIRRLEESARRYRGALLTTGSSVALAKDPALALLLAIEGARLIRDRNADDALNAALARIRETRTIQPPSSALDSETVAGSRDGRHFVGAAKGGVARVWDAATSRLDGVLRGPARELNAVAFSGDGHWIAAVSVPDQTVFVWNESAWTGGTSEGSHDADITAAAAADSTQHVGFSADGTRVLAWGLNGYCVVDVRSREARGGPLSPGKEDAAAWAPDGERLLLPASDQIWNSTTGESVRLETENALEHARCSGEFSPDGRFVVAGSGPDGVGLFDARTGARLRRLPLLAPPKVARFSPDGEALLVGGADGSCTLFVAATGEVKARWSAHTQGVSLAAFIGDGRRIETISDDGSARIWDAKWGVEVAALLCSSPITSCCELGGGEQFVTGHRDGSVRRWNREDGWSRDVLGADLLKDTYLAGCFDPRGERVAVTSGNEVRIYDVRTRELVGTLEGHAQRVHSVVFTPDGKSLLTASEDRTVRAWDAATFRQTAEIGAGEHANDVWCVDVSPDGTLVVTASADPFARLFDLRSGKPLRTFAHDAGRGLQCAHFSPDNRFVVTTSQGDGTIRVWDVRSGSPLYEPRRFESADAKPRTGRFSPDGRFLLAGARNGTIGVWDAVTGRAIWEDGTPDTIVNDACFSPDGTRILVASGSNAERLRVFDARTHEELASIVGHRGDVSCASFSPNGRTILSIANDLHAHLWPSDPLEAARARAPRDFTIEERTRYGLAADGPR